MTTEQREKEREREREKKKMEGEPKESTEEERSLLCHVLQKTGVIERNVLNLEAFAKVLVKKSRRSKNTNESPRSPTTPLSPSSSSSLDAVVDEILTYTSDSTIPTSLVKFNSGDIANRAVKMFPVISKYCSGPGLKKGSGEPSASENEAATNVNKILKDVIKRPEMTDEAYLQVLKQATHCKDSKEYEIRVWELLLYLCATAPPRNVLIAAVSEYIHTVVQERAKTKDDLIYQLATAAFTTLKKTAKRGAHKYIPQIEELTALTMPISEKLTAIIFFLDETFEELHYDALTSVSDAVEQVMIILMITWCLILYYFFTYK